MGRLSPSGPPRLSPSVLVVQAAPIVVTSGNIGTVLTSSFAFSMPAPVSLPRLLWQATASIRSANAAALATLRTTISHPGAAAVTSSMAANADPANVFKILATAVELEGAFLLDGQTITLTATIQAATDDVDAQDARGILTLAEADGAPF